MNFFERNRKALAEQGYDAARLPPGQYFTERFPVLSVGDVPKADLATWDLKVHGLVATPLTLSWDELLAMPATEIVVDIHCVTKWSKFDTTWTGVRVRDLFDAAGLQPEATHLLSHDEQGYSANLSLVDVVGDDALVAYAFNSEPLEPEHGYPARLVVPHLYFWKSTKWVRALELIAGDRPGFWERNGYHNYGDPWTEQRFWGD